MDEQHSAPSYASGSDVDQNKLIAAVSYLGIFCLVPLLLKKNSPFAQHHGKQGLVLLVAWIILWIGNIIPILGQIVWVLGSIALIILMLLGIVNTMQGRWWVMPVIGQYAKSIKL